jgi:hypothetical protein
VAGFSTALTPEADAEVNASGRGRHATYGGAVGIGHGLTPTLSASVDFAAFQHDEPQGPFSTRTAGASIAWMAARHLQLDVGTLVGLDDHSPSAQAYLGVAARF